MRWIVGGREGTALALGWGATRGLPARVLILLVYRKIFHIIRRNRARRKMSFEFEERRFHSKTRAIQSFWRHFVNRRLEILEILSHCMRIHTYTHQQQKQIIRES